MHADAILTAEWIEEAERVGVSRDTVEREFAKFKNHWLAESSQRAMKRDWLAAWRKWCLNAIDWQRPSKARGRISAAEITTSRGPLFGATR